MRNFVIEITPVIDALGTTKTHIFCTGKAFATRPTDTPANTHIESRVIDPGTITRELFSGDRTFGAVKPSYGFIAFANADGKFDDWKDYGVYGQTLVIREGEEGSAYPSEYTDVLIACAGTVNLDFDVMTLGVKDRLSELDKSVINSKLDGTGGAQGSDDGRYIQRAFVDPGLFPPVLIDEVKQIYLVQQESAGASQAFSKVYEGGVEITRENDYINEGDLIDNAPSIGRSRYWFGPSGMGPVYFRLGSNPVAQLRCQSNGARTPQGANFTTGDLAAEAGVIGASGGQVIANRLVDDTGTTYRELLNDQARIQLFSFGFDRLNNFFTTLFEAPGVTPVHTFTQHNSYNIRRDAPQGMSTPIYKISANIGKTWPTEFTGSASNAIKGILSLNPWRLQLTHDDESILTKHRSAKSMSIDVIGRYISSTISWPAIYNKFMSLFGVERDFITLTTDFDSETLQIDLHDTVQLKMPRFGMSAGKNFRVISQFLNLKDREITFGLWG